MMPNKNYIDADEKYVRNYTLYAPTDPSKFNDSAPAKLYFDPECTKRLTDGDLLKKMFDVGLCIRFADSNVEVKPNYYNPNSGGFAVVGYATCCTWAGDTWRFQIFSTSPNLED